MFMIDLGAQSYYSVLGVNPGASFAAIRAARDQMIKELKERLRTAQTETEKRLLEERQKEINAAGEKLARPDQREAYDRDNAHLKFFTVRMVAAPMFTEKADAFFVLHRTIRDFLASKGVTIPPLSDIEAQGFESDETPVELLDALLR